jgi:hypothetical protein
MEMENIWNILWPFGIFCGHLVYFFPFWYVIPIIPIPMETMVLGVRNAMMFFP